MLFLTHKPTNLLIINHNQIILTTPQQIIFTTLHFLEEFISKELAEQNPFMLHYSQTSSEAVTVSKEAIQIYWTDWGCKIQLRCFVALSHQPIYSIVWDDYWKIYGDFRQYSLARIKLIRIQSYDNDFSSCFLGENQYILTNKRLVSYSHKTKKLSEIEWPHRDDELSHLRQNEPIQMKVYNVKYGWIVVSISNLCILIRNLKVLVSLFHEGKLYVRQDVLVWIDHGKMMYIYQINDEQIIKLGEMEAFQGHYLGCTLTQQKLTMLFYDFKELQIKNIRLVNQDENLEYDARKKEKDRIKQGMKTSIQEHSHEHPINPLTSPQDSKQNIKINMTGSHMQLALKASIEKFQEELQKSFQSEKYNEQMQIQSEILHQIDEIRASRKGEENPVGVDVSKIQVMGIDSFDRVEQQINECQGLFEHGQSGLEWHQMESNYEQNIESSDIVNELYHMTSHDNPFNNQIQIDFAQTPAFNNVQNNNWEYARNQWNIQMSPQKDKPFQVQSTSKHSIQQKASSIIAKNNESKKYTQILSDIYRKQPEKFDEALQATMDKVIAENEARIFFADHIRIMNPSLTRDRLLRLYRHIDDNQQNRRMMGKALSQFRLEQVPPSCLPIKTDILRIFQKIYPSVYVEDLLEPTLRLIQQLIQSYFSKKFTYETLQIQDEIIELIHSRNLLNIILYLNDHYQLPIDSIFEVYIKKMIRHNQTSTLKRIMDSDVCSICGVDAALFERVAQGTIKQLLEENGTKTQLIQDTIILMSLKTRKIMTEILSLIGYFNQFDIKLKIYDIFNIPTRKNSENVIRQIIENCSPSSLSKLSMPFIFQSFGKIEEDKAPIYYQSWHIQICKQISQILFKFHLLKDGASILYPLSGILKRSFIVKLLIKYLNGKFANRLACPRQNPTQIINHILRIILESPFNQLEGDTFPEEKDNDSWIKFCTICRENLLYQCWQLAYILYHDRHLSRELVNESVISLSELQQLMEMADEPKNKPNNMSFLDLIPKHVQIPLIFQPSQHHSNESAEINQSLSPKSSQPKFLLQQSFRGYDIKNDIVNQQINRSLRYKDTSTDPALIILKLSVSRQSIITSLKQIYQEFPREKFIAALSLIDREKVQLYHIELFKSLAHSEIAYPFQNLLPFQYFLGEIEQAWNKVKSHLFSQLNHENFWIIYLLIDILYKRSDQVAIAFIQRIIFYQMDDQWHQQISNLLSGIKIPENKLKQLQQAAQQRNLSKISSVLQQKFDK